MCSTHLAQSYLRFEGGSGSLVPIGRLMSVNDLLCGSRRHILGLQSRPIQRALRSSMVRVLPPRPLNTLQDHPWTLALRQFADGSQQLRDTEPVPESDGLRGLVVSGAHTQTLQMGLP